MAVLGGTLALSSSFLIWSGTARWPNFSHAANVLAQLIIGTMLIAPIAYIAASANYPLQDAKLYAIDQLLGLDWRSYLNFVNEHELGGILKSGYATFLLQPVIVTIILCASGNVVRSYQFSLVFFLALLVTVLVSVFL